jgi:anti-anti-sigma regulatory factor
MSSAIAQQVHVAWESADEVTPSVMVIEFQSRELAGPVQGRELREQLESLAWEGAPRNLVLDFRNVRTIGSSVFGEITRFVRQFVRVRVCNMTHNLRLGAALIGLDEWVEFSDSRESAIAAAADDASRGRDDTADYPVMS